MGIGVQILERGWETTPPEYPWTDEYRWSKFLVNPAIRRATKLIPTTLKLGVAGREAWSPRRRRQEMAEWASFANAPGLFDIPVAKLQSARNDEPAMLRVTPEQMRALEQTWNFLSRRMPDVDIRPYLSRAVALDPADDAALRQLVNRMIADGESPGALRLAAGLAEETPLMGRRWKWISTLAAALGGTDMARYAKQRASSGIPWSRR